MAIRRTKPFGVSISRGRRATRAATRMTAASLANSLGVIDWPPMMIQRRAPLMLEPTPGTRTRVRAASTATAKGTAARRYQP